MGIEKLNPMRRPRRVRVEARINLRSWQTSVSSCSCRLRNRTPTLTESHITKKENASIRNGDRNSSFIKCCLVNSGHPCANCQARSRWMRRRGGGMMNAFPSPDVNSKSARLHRQLQQELGLRFKPVRVLKQLGESLGRYFRQPDHLSSKSEYWKNEF